MFFVLAYESVNPSIRKLSETWQINRGKFGESIENSFDNKMVLCESSTILQINLRYVKIQNKVAQSSTQNCH